MYCPNCGYKHDAPPRYCKSCGCNLVRVSASLFDEDSAEMGTVREKYFRRALTGALLSLAVVLAILWSLAFGVGQIKSDEIVPLASIVSWIAMMIVISNWVLARHLKKVDILKLNQARPEKLPQPSDQIGTDIQLDQPMKVSPFGFGEQTTELLPEKLKQPGQTPHSSA